MKLPYNNTSVVCRIKKPHLNKGTYLIIPTPYGSEVSIIQGEIQDMEDVLSQEEIFQVIRIATRNDKDKYRNNLKKSKEAFNIALKKIQEHNLEMKLINVHYFLEDSKILFNFTADGRIDFRELVKDLAAIFKTRIELRQIGVRDECRIMKGFGHCGRHLCCSNVNNELKPITIKMAKEQNITLNSLKISGICGRLLCCLSYEYDIYLKEKAKYPPEGTKISINNISYEVLEINIQAKTIKICPESHEFYHYVPIGNFKYNHSRKRWESIKPLEF